MLRTPRALESTFPAVVVTAMVFLAGCTGLLGIDHDYELGTHGGQTSLNAGGTTASGGVDVSSGGSGGVIESAGGTTSGGGVAVADASPPVVVDAATPEAGAVADPCGAASYIGTFEGTHALGATFVGVQIQASGTVTFKLEGSGSTRTVDGTFVGITTLATATSGTFSATLLGSYDCAAHTLSGQLTGQLTASLALPNLPPVKLYPDIQGTWSGSLDGNAFSGTWTEQEKLPIPIGTGGAGGAGTTLPGCKPNGPSATDPPTTGCGTWNAR